MRKHLSLIAILVLFALVAICGPRAAQVAPPTDGPAVLFFRSDSCVYCEEVKLVLDEVCHKYRRQLEVVTVDMEQEESKGLARQYGVVGIPTVLLLDREGHQVNVLRGTLPKSVVEQTVRDLVDR